MGAFHLLATPWGDAEMMMGHWVVVDARSNSATGLLGKDFS